MGTWKPLSESAKSNAPKLPYVGTWAHFSKLSEDDKAKVFNSMRATLLSSGMMESK